jgi:cell wall-associated NlpC family hydrolase
MTSRPDQYVTRALAVLAAISATALAVAATAPADPTTNPLAPIIRESTPAALAATFPTIGQGWFVTPKQVVLEAQRQLVAFGHRQRTLQLVQEMIDAGNQIATLPYIYGGGHGSFISSGYDCSGSVSFVLHAAGLLETPEDSSQLESYGLPGPGRYVTIYTNAEHAWMTIDGRRFDTIAYQETGTRWSDTLMPVAGYVIVHPAGF